jgi:hypothetical protein
MSDNLQRTAIARSIAAALSEQSLSEALATQVVVQTLEHIRNAGEWERREAGDDRSWHLVNHHTHTVSTPCGRSWEITVPVEQHDNPPLRERCTACWRAAASTSPGGPALGEALLVVIAELAERDRSVAARQARQEAARAEMLRERDDIRSDHFAHCTFVPEQDQPQSGFCARDGFTMESHCLQCYREHRKVRIVPAAANVTIGLPGDDLGDRLDPETGFAPDQHLTVVRSDSEVIALGDERARDVDREVEIEWGIDQHAGSGT